MLYASTKAQEQMRSLGHFFNPSKTLQDKIGLAGSTYELTSTIPRVVEYLDGKWDDIVANEVVLQSTLLAYLNGRDDVTVHGETSADRALRVPTVSFTVKGWDSKELVETVEKDTNFGFRWGAFYSNRLVNDFLGRGPDGIVRVSMVHYNTGKPPSVTLTSIATVPRHLTAHNLYRGGGEGFHRGTGQGLVAEEVGGALQKPRSAFVRHAASRCMIESIGCGSPKTRVLSARLELLPLCS